MSQITRLAYIARREAAAWRWSGCQVIPIDVACEACGSRPGMHCRWKTGRERAIPHGARERTAVLVRRAIDRLTGEAEVRMVGTSPSTPPASGTETH